MCGVGVWVCWVGGGGVRRGEARCAGGRAGGGEEGQPPRHPPCVIQLGLPLLQLAQHTCSRPKGKPMAPVM